MNDKLKPTLVLQRSISQSKAARATELTEAERFRGGADLYDEGMQWLMAAILAENPEFSDEEIDAELERRKTIVKRIDDNGMFKPFTATKNDGTN